MNGERCPTLVQLIKMTTLDLGSPGGSDGKESACNAGDLGLTPDPGRSLGETNGYPLSILAWRSPQAQKPGVFSNLHD